MDAWSADGLVLLGALASIQLAQGKTAQEVALLAAFFNILGDNLDLLALAAPDQAEGVSCPDTPSVPPAGP